MASALVVIGRSQDTLLGSLLKVGLNGPAGTRPLPLRDTSHLPNERHKDAEIMLRSRRRDAWTTTGFENWGQRLFVAIARGIRSLTRGRIYPQVFDERLAISRVHDCSPFDELFHFFAASGRTLALLQDDVRIMAFSTRRGDLVCTLPGGNWARSGGREHTAKTAMIGPPHRRTLGLKPLFRCRLRKEAMCDLVPFAIRSSRS
jgi:hypothetical protein